MKKVKIKWEKYHNTVYIIENTFIKATIHILLYTTMISYGKRMRIRDKKQADKREPL